LGWGQPEGACREDKSVLLYGRGPPNTTAAIFWLKNRRPHEWRDVQNVDAAVGHYIISDRPMTEEQWIKERADRAKVVPTLSNKLDDTDKPLE
jgi:hypothetical protein